MHKKSSYLGPEDLFKGIYKSYTKKKKNEVMKNDIAAFFIMIALLKSS